MNRDLWHGVFAEDHFPPFPCPTCQAGVLRLEEGTLQKRAPKFLLDRANHPDWDIDWDFSRFIAFMRCPAPSCGEVVTVAGRVEDTEYEDDEVGWAMKEALYPSSVLPAPHVISFPEKLNSKSKRHLLKAFELLWIDAGASANRLRICVEVLLDQFKVPRNNKPKIGKKRVRLSLGTRLTKLKGRTASQKHILDALRVIGNVGSHDGHTERDTLLIAFSLLEDVLAELIDKRTANRDKLARQIVAANGKLKD